MKGIVVKKPYELDIIDFENVEIINDTDVIVKMKVAGICGSDVHIYHGTNAAATYPRVMGHEMVGEVYKTGKSVSKVKIGDRVIINQVISCGKCYACKNDRGNVCSNLKVRGVHTDGGFKEYVLAPESDLYILPKHISNKDAVMIEPTTIALQCLSRGDVNADDILLILGCGALGSSILKIAKLIKCKIIVADTVDEKLDIALSNGADYAFNILKCDLEKECKNITNGDGVTVSIDAACTKDTLPLLLDVTCNAGRVITMGFSTEITPVTQFKITSKELDVRGSRLQNKKFSEVIDLINNKTICLDNSISHEFNFLDAKKAFEFIDTKDASIRKVVLTFD